MTAATHCEHTQAEHDATKRLTDATHLLVIVTAVLVLATGVLTYATFKEKSEPHVEPTNQGEVK